MCTHDKFIWQIMEELCHLHSGPPWNRHLMDTLSPSLLPRWSEAQGICQRWQQSTQCTVNDLRTQVSEVPQYSVAQANSCAWNYVLINPVSVLSPAFMTDVMTTRDTDLLHEADFSYAYLTLHVNIRANGNDTTQCSVVSLYLVNMLRSCHSSLSSKLIHIQPSFHACWECICFPSLNNQVFWPAYGDVGDKNYSSYAKLTQLYLTSILLIINVNCIDFLVDRLYFDAFYYYSSTLF